MKADRARLSAYFQAGEKMAGIQDVARLAGVGTGTVSRVINGSGYVSSKTRDRVERAVAELSYTPNELARNLLQNRSRIIALIVPDLSYPFFAELACAVEQRLMVQGYKTMICNAVRQSTNEEEYLSMLDRNIVDGVLTATHSLKHEQYFRSHKPIVSFDMFYHEGEIPMVTVDHERGGRLAAEELLQAGCRRLLQFRDAEEAGRFSFMERHRAFEESVHSAGAKCRNVYLEWNEFREDYYAEIAEKALSEYPDVDGIFGTDGIVLHCMRAALMRGRRIPEELRLVAYDGTKALNTAYPSVTALVQPIEKLAEAGVKLLLQRIEGKKLRRDKIVLSLKLRRGMTTGHSGRRSG